MGHGAAGAGGGSNGAAHDATSVLARLEEAGRTVLALPPSGWTTALRTSRILPAPDPDGEPDRRLRPPRPEAAAIDRMDEAYRWLALIPPDRIVLRRILAARSLVCPLTGRHRHSWRALGSLLHADHRAVQRWHADGIRLVVAALNRR